MAHSAKRTIDHDKIRRWVEARGGEPAHVKRTGHGDQDPGILRIDFPGYSGEGTLEPLAWDAWFEAFESNGLAFLFQDEKDSRFSKLVRRTGDEDEEAETADKRAGSAQRASAQEGVSHGRGSAASRSGERDVRTSAGAGSKPGDRPHGGSRRWSSRTERVTINDATAEELDALWGVGPQNARRILDWRRRHGRISGPDDLAAIDGIDGATARTIAQQVDFG